MPIGQPLNADTLVQAATAAAPGAGGDIVTMTPPVGTYQVEASLYLSGTAETAILNGSLRKGAVEICKVVTPGVPSLVAVTRVQRVSLDGATALHLVAIGAATAGSVYTGFISAQRVE